VKRFQYGDIVRVALPGKRPFLGKFYSEYRALPRSQRTICVEVKSGAGIGYPVRYVTLAKPKRK
jgi:hypothetical protein